jgi:hypothetical protein
VTPVAGSLGTAGLGVRPGGRGEAARWLALSTALAALGGCATGAATRASAPALTPCPEVLVGTSIEERDVGGGTALVFTTADPAAVEGLRRQVRHLAAVHDDHHRADGARLVDFRPAAERDPLGAALATGTRIPAASAVAEDVAGGARLVLRATDPREVAALREQARLQASKLPGASCEAPAG